MKIGFFKIYLTEKESATLTSPKSDKKRHNFENRIYREVFKMYDIHPQIAIKFVPVVNPNNDMVAKFYKPGTKA